MGRVSIEFTCKCKKQKGWIEHGQTTKPCPDCGRVYKGKYSERDMTILAVEVNHNG